MLTLNIKWKQKLYWHCGSCILFTFSSCLHLLFSIPWVIIFMAVRLWSDKMSAPGHVFGDVKEFLSLYIKYTRTIGWESDAGSKTRHTIYSNMAAIWDDVIINNDKIFRHLKQTVNLLFIKIDVRNAQKLCGNLSKVKILLKHSTLNYNLSYFQKCVSV